MEHQHKQQQVVFLTHNQHVLAPPLTPGQRGRGEGSRLQVMGTAGRDYHSRHSRGKGTRRLQWKCGSNPTELKGKES